MKAELIPALLVQTEEDAVMKLMSLGEYKGWIQIDILDGTLYRYSNFHDPSLLALLMPANGIELHLMVSDPLSHLQAWQKTLGTHERKRVIWHIEALVDHKELIAYAKSHGWECGIAIGPLSSTESLRPYLQFVDEILVLGVHPGKSGQSLLPKTLDTVRELKQQSPRSFVIGFDGGVNGKTIPDLLMAGVERLNVASAVFQSEDPERTLRDLERKLV